MYAPIALLIRAPARNRTRYSTSAQQQSTKSKPPTASDSPEDVRAARSLGARGRLVRPAGLLTLGSPRQRQRMPASSCTRLPKPWIGSCTPSNRRPVFGNTSSGRKSRRHRRLTTATWPRTVLVAELRNRRLVRTVHSGQKGESRSAAARGVGQSLISENCSTCTVANEMGGGRKKRHGPTLRMAPSPRLEAERVARTSDPLQRSPQVGCLNPAGNAQPRFRCRAHFRRSRLGSLRIAARAPLEAVSVCRDPPWF